MKKVIVYAVMLLMAGLLYACAEKDKKAEAESCAPLNPNGDSELAILMREMAKLSEENAVALRQGKELVPYNGGFDRIFMAKRSMNVEEDFFQGMAKNYISTLNQLYSAPPEKRVELHNNLVQSCQSCHEQSCRGPLKRIDKMLVAS